MSKPKLALACIAVIFTAGLSWLATRSQRSVPTMTYSRFLQEVRTGQVDSVVLLGSNSGAVQATGKLKAGKTVQTVFPSDYKDALTTMQEKLVNIEIREPSSQPFRLFINAIPFLLLLTVWLFLIRRKVPVSF